MSDDSQSLRHEQLCWLFDRAMQVPPHQQQAFAVAECGTDADMRDKLLALLAAAPPASVFFENLDTDVLSSALEGLSLGPADDASDDLQAALQDELGGVYRISHELAGGAMSRVFVAEDVSLGRSVVLKALRPELVRTADAARFRREIEMAAQLQHVHIVPVLAAGVAGDAAYYTMPFVAGETLRDRLAHSGALSIDDALHIWRDILDALAYAHAHGVIHRDIKPGNILLSGRHALVTDFGVARAIEAASPDPRATSPGLAIGTPAYMAPEQVAGDADADERVDVYAAGLVMYEMLAGTPPFSARSSREHMAAHLNLAPPPLGPAIPAPLADLVLQCLAKEPVARPSGVDAVLQALDGMDDPLQHSVKRARVRPRKVAAYAAVVLLIIVGFFARYASTQKPPVPSVSAGGTTNIAAHEWYLRGMDLSLMRSTEGTLRAISYFKRAIALDSMYAAAYSGLARADFSMWSGSPDRERQKWLDDARKAAATAMRRDPSSPDAHNAVGMTQLMGRDLAAAESSFKRALALNHNVPRGHENLARVYMMMRRPAEQLREARLGFATDSFSHSAMRELALALATNGRCDESLASLRALEEMTPPATVAGVLRGQCFASRADWPHAIAEFRWADSVGAAYALAGLGYALGRGGKTKEAKSILDDLLAGRKESHGAFGIATVYAGLRDYDKAFLWLDRAVDDNTVNAYIMHPMYADLQRDPRFARITRRLNEPAR